MTPVLDLELLTRFAYSIGLKSLDVLDLAWAYPEADEQTLKTLLIAKSQAQFEERKTEL